MKLRLLIPIVFFAVLSSCSKKTAAIVNEVENEDFKSYVEDHKLWQQKRIASLTKPMGYMSLAGLYWIDKDETTFGSSRDADLQFPEAFPDIVGRFINKDDMLSVEFSCDEKMKINNEFDDHGFILADDTGHATMMNWRSYFWYLIKRGDRLGVRLKDTLSDARMNLESIPAYEVKEEWLKEAKFIASTNDEKISIVNHIGVTTESKLAGHVFFTHNKKGHFLSAVDAGNNLFVVFGDQTNGEETYGGGRFLYIPKPIEGTETFIDFNRAENPICAFNDYATCPLPLDDNKLPFAVLAGEKKVRDSDH